MCLVPSIEDTIWDFDVGNPWALHVSMEMLCGSVTSFRMDRNSLHSKYSFCLILFGSEYLSYKAGTQIKPP